MKSVYEAISYILYCMNAVRIKEVYMKQHSSLMKEEGLHSSSMNLFTQ